MPRRTPETPRISDRVTRFVPMTSMPSRAKSEECTIAHAPYANVTIVSTPSTRRRMRFTRARRTSRRRATKRAGCSTSACGGVIRHLLEQPDQSYFRLQLDAGRSGNSRLDQTNERVNLVRARTALCDDEIRVNVRDPRAAEAQPAAELLDQPAGRVR